VSTIFTKIINREIPAHIVAEDERFIAFLDISPLQKGHTLVVPKFEVDYIFDLDDDLLSGMHLFSKRVARGIKEAIPCNRIGMAVLGMEVPHAHIHLVPLTSEGDLSFSNPKLQLSSDEMDEIANAIRLAI